MSGYSTFSTFATVGASDQTALGAQLGRRCVIVSPPNAGRVTIQFGRAAVIDQGPTIQAGTAPLRMDYDEYGDLIEGDIHAIADAANRTVGITVGFRPRS